MKKIIFHGDSITDAGRNRESISSLGEGYPRMIAGDIGYRQPCRFEFINQGINGSRIVDLYARWKKDCLNYLPDYISILIGVNDVWHEYSSQNGVTAKRFKQIYSMLLEDTQEYLPKVKLMLIEPFILHGTVTDADWSFFHDEVVKRQQAVRELSKQYGTAYLPMQAAFDRATEAAPADYWASDGVHPTAAGHAFIAERWSDLFLEQQSSC